MGYFYGSPNEQGQGSEDPRGEDNPYGGYGNKTTGAGGYDNKSGNFSTDDNKLGGGQGGGENKITTTASTVATVPYASPYEQGNGLGPEWNGLLSTSADLSNRDGGTGGSIFDISIPDPITPVTTVNTAVAQPVNTTTYIENDYEDDWMRDWQSSFETNVESQFGNITKGQAANTDLINSNQAATGLEIEGVSDEVSSVQEDLTTATDGINEELLNLSGLQKQYGLQITDAEGNIINLEKDILQNNKTIDQNKNAATAENNSVLAEIDAANTEIDSNFQTTEASIKAQEKAAEALFQGATDSTAALLENLKTNGLGNTYLDVDDSGDKRELPETYITRKALLDAINADTATADITLTDYLDGIEAGKITATDEIVDLMESYQKAKEESLGASDKANKEIIASQGDKEVYGQQYWVDRMSDLKKAGKSNDEIQNIVLAEQEILGTQKSYSGDVVVTAADQNSAWESLMGLMPRFGINNLGPNTPKEYIYDQLLANISTWAKDPSSGISVDTSTSGLFDENTTSVYTMPNGQSIIIKGTDPSFDLFGEKITLGATTNSLFVDGVGLANDEGGNINVVDAGLAEDVNSTVDIGSSIFDGDDVENTTVIDPEPPKDPKIVDPEPPEDPDPEDPDPEDPDPEFPLPDTDPDPDPDELPDPNGTGAFGQDGNAFSLDGVTFWKRIKDRNGRWSYTRVNNYQTNGTSSRRSSWGADVINV